MNKYSVVAASIFALSVSMPAFADDTTNVSQIDQVGVGLTVDLTQTGDRNDNKADVEQGLGVAGDNLSAKILQTGEDTFSDAKVVQNGSDQSIIVEQRGLSLTDNFTSIQQDGSNNMVDVLQNGTGNINDATIVQQGNGTLNTANVQQGGMGSTNNSVINQNGGGLTANVVQN